MIWQFFHHVFHCNVSRHHRKWQVSNIGIGSDSEVLLLVEAIALSKLHGICPFSILTVTTCLALRMRNKDHVVIDSCYHDSDSNIISHISILSLSTTNKST